MENMWKSWKNNPTPENQKALLNKFKPVIDSALTSYAGKFVSPTVRGRAQLMAFEALKTYDPTKGASIKNYLLTQLRPIGRYSQRLANPVHIPEKRISDMYNVRNAKRELYDVLGRDPTDDELADRTNLSKQRLKTILQSEFNPPSVNLSDDFNGQPDIPIKFQDPEEVWMDFVYHDMDPINKKIMEWKLGLYGNPVLKNQEIAQKLRITPAAISQRTNQIIKRLREYDTIRGSI